MPAMHWTVIVSVALAIAILLAFKLLGPVRADAAREYLRQGAQVIDVRSPDEYRARHVPHAINIPLHELAQQIGRHAPNKDGVLLLHCLSGGRSGVGVRVLKRAGYTRVFNLGSFSRAERIVGHERPPENP